MKATLVRTYINKQLYLLGALYVSHTSEDRDHQTVGFAWRTVCKPHK